MNKTYLLPLVCYFVLISLITVIITISDKIKAKKGKRRISEKTLILLGLFGGALAEYITMKFIRHKTLHKKFMLGLPLIILLHIVLFCFLYFKISPGYILQ